MSDISFKKFAQFLAIEGEPTDEQITEIFGFFKNNTKVDALKARKAELDAKKKKLAQQHADALMAKAAKQHRDNAGFDTKERGSATVRAAAASGRAAENDWVRGLVGEGKRKPSRVPLPSLADRVKDSLEDYQSQTNGRITKSMIRKSLKQMAFDADDEAQIPAAEKELLGIFGLNEGKQEDYDDWHEGFALSKDVRKNKLSQSEAQKIVDGRSKFFAQGFRKGLNEEQLDEAFRHLNANRIRTLDHFGSASEAPEERRMLVKALALLGKSLPEDKVFTYDQNADAKIFVRLMRANKVANPDKPGIAELLRAGFEKAKRMQGLTFLTKDGIVAVVNEDGPTKLIMA